MATTELYLHLLRFDSRAGLTSAFDRILASERVASCAVEPELSRIRFLAPRRVGAALLEAIYADGGLVWSSRHPTGESADGPSGDPER